MVIFSIFPVLKIQLIIFIKIKKYAYPLQKLKDATNPNAENEPTMVTNQVSKRHSGELSAALKRSTKITRVVWISHRVQLQGFKKVEKAVAKIAPPRCYTRIWVTTLPLGGSY